MENSATYSFWIFKHKLLGILIILTEMSVASFDKEDYNAILHGLTQSDSDSNTFFDYIFLSNVELKMRFALNTDNKDIIHLHVSAISDSFIEEVKRLDRFQSYISNWTLLNENYFYN